MKECPYLHKNGKKCSNKLIGGAVICDKHNKNQKGGFIYELVYPLGASVGAATFGLYRMNNMINTWYHSKHNNSNKSKITKNNNGIIQRKK